MPFNNDFEIFGNKNFSDLCEETYRNIRSKNVQLDTYIDDVKKMIAGINDAVLLTPRIKEFVDTSIKNDTSMIRLLDVMQRTQKDAAADGGRGDFSLTDEERKDLLSNVIDIQSAVKANEATLNAITPEANKKTGTGK